MNFKKKIDLVLLKLEYVKAKMNTIDDKFNNLTATINKIETKFKTRNEEVKRVLLDKADLKTIRQLNEKIAKLSILTINLIEVSYAFNFTKNERLYSRICCIS